MLTSWLVEKILRKAIELTYIGTMLAYIHVRSARQLNEVEKIIKEVSQSEEELTDEKIDEIDKRLAEAGRKLIKFGTIG